MTDDPHETDTPCSAVARPITARAKEYHAWRARLAADPTCWKFSEREDAIAFAAFIAGWWLRTGDNPDAFFNPPNAESCRRWDTDLNESEKTKTKILPKKKKR